MKELSQYQIRSTLHEGIETIIYRGQTPTYQEPIILKLLKAEYPTLEAITRLKHEYQIRQTLDHPNIVKVLSLDTFNHRLALLLEDFGGCSLAQLLQTEKLTVTRGLRIAILLAKALEYLHQNQIIHKDIKLSNIIINRQTGIVKLTDFGIASCLSKENPFFTNPNSVEGTLAYMSPEQTGRMNRILDYRTDFYSFGVTLYEMLTGELPFQSDDPLEIVYSHIAKFPTSPQQLNPEIPPAISEIVMKLMAKNAEDRYQSAAGLLADLEICLNQLTTTNTITDFLPGRVDVLSQLLIPQKLYGREAQVSLLLEAFERVSQGTRELMLVSGYSGIGKSAVVNEVNKPITRQRGYFISGKFDQFKRNIPYASLTQAIGSLMRQLLTESDAKLQEWRSKILTALGSNGQVIIDVIPEVELIIGKQPEVPQLSSTESQNRFNQVFKEFIRVFTQKEHPLVIFLDDLQWTDSATSKLMQLLVTDPDSNYLLFIGAYRDNEVSPTHPLIQIVKEIEKTDTVVNNIVLQPLDLGHVTQLIADTLPDRTVQITPLAELIHNKTGGNPFFLTQLLQSLYQENLLRFVFTTLSPPYQGETTPLIPPYQGGTKGGWQWNLEEIQAIGIADKSVVELVAARIKKLPEATQNVLKLAACIGDRFTLDVLSIVSEQSPNTTAIALYPALQSGLILPLSEAYKIPLVFDEQEINTDEIIKSKIPNLNSKVAGVGYKFLHDRVQQAAYSLIPKSQKKATHLKIGQLLLNSIPEAEIEENIFEIVNQLNIGVEFLANSTEKIRLAQLNLIAGRKAKAATAYEPALVYLTVGLELLAQDSWQTQYNLTLELYLAVIEAHYLNANFDQAEIFANIALAQATTLLDTVAVYQQIIQLCIGQNEMLNAIATGRQVLEMLGISLSNFPSNRAEAITLPNLENLETLPAMIEPHQLAAMQILMLIAPAAYIANPPTYLQVILTLVNLAIAQGYSAISAFAFGQYGAILCGVMGNIDAGYHSAQLSFTLLEQFKASELKTKVYLPIYGFIRHWKEHLRETIPGSLEGFHSGLEVGNIEFAGYNALRYCEHVFFVGEPLDSAREKLLPYIQLMDKFKQDFNSKYINIWYQTILSLKQEVASDNELWSGEHFDEAVNLQGLLSANNQMSICCVYLAKAILYYLFKQPARSLENAIAASHSTQAVMGAIAVAEHNFYYSLALLHECPTLSYRKRKKSLSQVQVNQESMQHWACHAPMNFQHKYDLVEAEKARVLKRKLQAMEYYDRAIKGAREQGYIQEEALANELAGEFYLSCAREKIARGYLTDAYYGYIRWGAIAKVKELQSRHPFLLEQTQSPQPQTFNSTRTTKSTTTGSFNTSLDLATFIKFSQAITSEIVLDNLLTKLIKILLENAAAQKGVLLLLKDDQLYIEAMGTATEESVTSLQSIPLETSQDLPVSVVKYVFRTKENLVLSDATVAERFNTDTYIQNAQPRSILCLPILYQSKLQGIIYLENNLTVEAFTQERVEVLNVLVSQVAIALENALLYEELETANQQLTEYSHTLEEKVEQRTAALKAAQKQIIAKEKLSSLGALTAGVAHELRNPLNFVNNYGEGSVELTEELLEEIDNQAEHLDADTLDYIKQMLTDIRDNAVAIHQHGQRAEGIIQSMMQHARTDSGQRQLTELNALLDQAVQLAYHSRRAIDSHFNVAICKDYDGSIGCLEVVASDLNRAFINAIDNACYAIRAKQKQYQQELRNDEEVFTPTLWVKTQNLGDAVEIRIRDNGMGIPPEIREKIFHPFFTTKPTGEGTGLGLSITHNIIVEQHGGTLKVETELGAYTEFIVTLPRVLSV